MIDDPRLLQATLADKVYRGHVDTNEYPTPDAHFAWTGQYLYDRQPVGSIKDPIVGGHGPQLPPAVQANMNRIAQGGDVQLRGQAIPGEGRLSRFNEGGRYAGH